MGSFVGRRGRSFGLLGAGLMSVVLLAGCGGGGESDVALDLKQPGDGNPVKVFVNENQSEGTGTGVSEGEESGIVVGEGEGDSSIVGGEEDIVYSASEEELLAGGWVPSGVQGVTLLPPVELASNVNISGEGISVELAREAYVKASALAGRNLSLQGYWRNSGATGKGLVADEFDNIDMELTAGYMTPEASGVWLDGIQVGQPGNAGTTAATRQYAGTLLAFPPVIDGLWSDPAFNSLVGLSASSPTVTTGGKEGSLVLEFKITGYAGYYPVGSEKLTVLEVSRVVKYEMSPLRGTDPAGWALASWAGSKPVEIRDVSGEREWVQFGGFTPGVLSPEAGKTFACRPPVTVEEFEDSPEGVCEWVEE